MLAELPDALAEPFGTAVQRMLFAGLAGQLIADVVACIGTIDIVLGDVDR